MIQRHAPAAFSRSTLNTLLGVYGVCLLVALLLATVLHGAADGFNQAVLLGLHAHTGPTIDHMALVLTSLGSAKHIAIASAVLAIAFFALGKRFHAFLLAAVVGGGAAIGWALKHVVKEARPHVFEPLARETGYAFPSGHTLLSFCLFGFIAAWLLLLSPGQREPWRLALAVAAVGLATLVGLSRLVLGVHYPTDVLASVALGTGWLFACLVGAQKLARA